MDNGGDVPDRSHPAGLEDGSLEPLPIDPVLPALVAALRAGPAAVLVAPPGAGKTTRVPPALAAAGIGGGGQVVVLEPRRIAARAAARRIAAERGWEVGREVGYQVRFERRAGPATRILVATEGILLQRLQADPLLEGVGAIVFDEFHERSVAADLTLAMARQVQREVRPDLALVAMSATLDPGPLAAFLGDCQILESHGRLFPVEIRYRERPAPDPAGRPRGGPGPLAAAVRDAVAEALDDPAAGDGDLLVFLPGIGEIERAGAALAPLASARDLAVVPLYGDLPPERQDAALRPLGRRKVVLATNVAETSVTVEGVTAVVDGGLARRLRYDPATGLDRLETGRISRAAADQRAGRAGRERPGLCLRLWPEREQAALAARETPEIARVDLASPALQLLAWGERDLAAFGWLERPDPAALARALTLLADLGAIDADRRPTAAGRAMARLPLHPRLARLLVDGRARGVAREAALVAALLAERDPFRSSPERRSAAERRAVSSSPSDLLDRADALAGFARRGRAAGPLGERLDPGAARSVLAARDQLAREVERDPSPAPESPPGDRDAHLAAAILAAFPDRLARRREPGSPRALMVGGRGVRLAVESALAGSTAELFVAVDVDDRRDAAEGLVRLASAVDPADLPPARLAAAVDLEWDAARERVTAWKRTRYRDLVVAASEVPAAADDAARVLAQAAAARLDRALPLADPEVASFLARVRSLRLWMPELGLPAFDEPELRDLLPLLAAGRRSFAELRRSPLAEVLAGTLGREQRQALAREAPERLRVPSGRELRLAYEPGRPPVLAARIQELFGWSAAPRIAAGRIPVLLHLLAPNGRPQQVTDDLASFWRNGYPQVRRELRGRYPKHAWPEDPTAG
jgi:ATP-dependent helicase HrpB